jgi:hypothetical protein
MTFHVSFSRIVHFAVEEALEELFENLMREASKLSKNFPEG